MRSVKVYLIVAAGLILLMEVFWAIEPYVSLFSAEDSFESDRAIEELSVESKARFAHRFVVGAAVGAGFSLILIVPGCAIAKKRRTEREEA